MQRNEINTVLQYRNYDKHPGDIFHPYLNPETTHFDPAYSNIPAIRQHVQEQKADTLWKSNPWMREREKLANGEPVYGVNTGLWHQFMVPADRPGPPPMRSRTSEAGVTTHDGIIYHSPHCGCYDCRTGGLGLSKDCDGYYIARSADHYQGEYGPTLNDVYRGPNDAVSNGSDRNKMHSRVMSGVDSGVLYPNYDPEIHDQRIFTRWLGDPARQMAPVAFGQPVTFKFGCTQPGAPSNTTTILYKIPNVGRTKDQFEFRERTGYTPQQLPIMAPPELRKSNIAACETEDYYDKCLHGRTNAFRGRYGAVQSVPGANADSVILRYKPCIVPCRR